MPTERLPPRTAEDGLAFRPRSREPSRLEGFSDAVFGFAITLLVVSLEVPRTFDELAAVLKGAPAFAVSFSLLFLIWHAQYRWFRHYGLHDGVSIFLHATLLFLVVLFVYPLKFVFTLAVGEFMHLDLAVHRSDGSVVLPLQPGQAGTMMLMFGVGYLAVFAVFALLNAHALRCRDQLGLDALEVADTREHLRENVLNGLIAIASMSLVSRLEGRAGLVYMIATPIALTVHGTWSGRRRRRIEEQFQPATSR